MIRVLVVDDSPTARALLVHVLRSDPDIQVVGEASDGVEAVALTRRLRPDLVTMDIQMPRMDGFEATKEIMIETPTPIVVVTGGLDNKEVSVSMLALRAGALCVLQKPPGPGAPGHIREIQQVLETVKAMSQVKVVRHVRPVPRNDAPPASVAARTGRRQAVAIAASTGGPAILHHLLSMLPAAFPAPILVVQHMTVGFTPGLVTLLNASSLLRVKVAEAGDKLAPQTVYLAPDERHLGVSGCDTIALSSAPPIGGFRPSATFLFESVARAFGAGTVAIILSGMGQDGVAGLRAVKELGGRTVAQDEETSVVFGMPGAAVAAGLADQVLPRDALAAGLVKLASGGMS
jgi:two-component system, chemotaxis family, protein-glutamate methylesterase/glutaminase